MAILTDVQLADMRRRFAEVWGESAIDYDKTTINAAFQALEDWYQSNKASIGPDINAATSPYTFSAAEKRQLGAMYFHFRFTEDR